MIFSYYISLGIERILSILEEKYKASGQIRTNSCECFVASIGKGLISNRLNICSKLWEGGIKAETDYTTNPKPKR